MLTRAEVNMTAADGRLRLSIRDDGTGFNPDDIGEADGLGMANMRERANLVGGLLEVKSRAGNGTQIVFDVPLMES